MKIVAAAAAFATFGGCGARGMESGRNPDDAADDPQADGATNPAPQSRSLTEAHRVRPPLQCSLTHSKR